MELALLQILVESAVDVEEVAAEVAEGTVADIVFVQNLYHNPLGTNFFAPVVLRDILSWYHKPRTKEVILFFGISQVYDFIS